MATMPATSSCSHNHMKNRHWGPSAMHSRLAGDLHETEHQFIAGNKVLRYIPSPALRALVRRSTLLLIDARELIFSQGDDGTTVLVVLQGYVKLSATMSGGREAIFDIAGP